MVSIIICTRKVNGKLTKCLDSIYAQDYKDYEVIIETEGSIQEARKRGIAKAKGDYICLVDDDQILAPYCLAECMKKMRMFDAVTWTERGLYHNTFMEKVIDYDKELFHEACDDDPVHGAAEPRFFKAVYLKNLNWSKLPPVTFELTFINKQVWDMGANIGFINDTLAWHHEPKNSIELFRKFFRYGYYYIPALKIDANTIRNHSKPRRAYFSWRALRKPLLYCGLWYCYSIKAVAAAGGAIWYLVKH